MLLSFLKAMGLMLSTLSVPLPKSGIVLGGTIELHGTNISLACFHGINFKVKINCYYTHYIPFHLNESFFEGQIVGIVQFT